MHGFKTFWQFFNVHAVCIVWDRQFWISRYNFFQKMKTEKNTEFWHSQYLTIFTEASKTFIKKMMTNSDWCKLQGWDNPKKDFQSQSWKVKIFAKVSSVIWSLFKMGWNFIVQISGLGGSRICFVIEEVTSLQSQSKDKVLSLLKFVAQFSVAGLEKL